MCCRKNPHLCANPNPDVDCFEEDHPVVELLESELHEREDQLPTETEHSTEKDLNATFGKVADLRSAIYKFVGF